MGWNASLDISSKVGSSVVFTPDTTSSHGYTVSVFQAPKKGVYRFRLYGSGGYSRTPENANWSSSPGGTGGSTEGYLLLEAGDTVYVGAGGAYSAAFVSRASGAALKNIAKEDLYFVAGGGGGGGAMWDNSSNNSAAGGDGGGITGENGDVCSGYRGFGGTQTEAGQGNGGYGEQGGYGYGGGGGYGNDGYSLWRGDGGDGLYGGGAGGFPNGGGGGSGYIHESSIQVGSREYANTTWQGGGAGSNAYGSVVVTYYADGELPVTFNGVRITELYFDGTKVDHFVYNGTAVFMHRLKRGIAAVRKMLLLLRSPVGLKEALI